MGEIKEPKLIIFLLYFNLLIEKNEYKTNLFNTIWRDIVIFNRLDYQILRTHLSHHPKEYIKFREVRS